jgi:hypothetical protein
MVLCIDEALAAKAPVKGRIDRLFITFLRFIIEFIR